jgi:hypothetical protein
MESKPMELPKEWVEKIETNAKRISGHQPDEDSTPFRNGLYSGYKSGSNAYAPWLYTCQMNYAALQAKVERYEALLQAVHQKAKEGIFPHEAMAVQKCIEIHAALNEALSAGDRICPNCNKVFNGDRHGCCRECGSYEYKQKEGK